MKYWNFTTFFVITAYLAFIAFITNGTFFHFFGE